jgi:hypothetical protein
VTLPVNPKSGILFDNEEVCMIAVKGKYDGMTVLWHTFSEALQTTEFVSRLLILGKLLGMKKGTVLLDQLITLDYKARSFLFIESVPSDFLLQLLNVAQRIFTV